MIFLSFLVISLAPGSTDLLKITVSLGTGFALVVAAVATGSYILVALQLRNSSVYVEVIVSGVGYPLLVVMLGRVVLVDALSFVLHRLFPTAEEQVFTSWLIRNCKVAFFFSGQLVIFWISSFGGFCVALTVSIAADTAGLAVKANLAKRLDVKRMARGRSPTQPTLAQQAGLSSSSARSAAIAPAPLFQAPEPALSSPKRPRITLVDWLRHLKSGGLVDKLRSHYEQEEAAEKSLCFSVCLVAVLWQIQIRGVPPSFDLAGRVAVLVVAEHVEDYAKNVVFCYVTESPPFLLIKNHHPASLRDGVEVSTITGIMLIQCLILQLVTGFEA